MEAGSAFWDTVQNLQEQNVFCDIQLTVSLEEDSSIVDTIFVHKLILVACSKFFQDLLQNGDLYDVYSFVGVSKENLQVVVDYMYRRLSWEELVKIPEAASTAQTIQILSHDVAATTSPQKPGVISTIFEESKKDEIKSGSSIKKKNEKKDIKTPGGKSKLEALVDDEGDAQKSPGKSSTPVDSPRNKNINTLKVSKNNHRDEGLSLNKMDAIEPKVKEKNSGPDHKANPPEEGSSVSDFRTSRTSRRRRKTLNYKLLSEGKDDYDDEAFETVSPKVRLVHLDAEQVSVADAPPKKKRGRPPKPLTNVLYIDNEGVQETPSETGENHEVSGDNTENQELNHNLSTPNIDEHEKKDGKYKGDSETKPSASGSQAKPETVFTVKLSETFSEGENTVITTAPDVSECSSTEKAASERCQSATTVTEQTEQRWPVGLTNPFPCDRCRRNFKSKNALAQHRKIIHKIKELVQCSICDEEFESNALREKHMKSLHQLTLYHCQDCDMQFKSKEGYNIHWQKKHSGQGPNYTCEYCNKQFYLRGELRSHMQYKHTLSRDFKCDLCTRAFKSKPMLQRHVNTYHSSVRKYKCEVCGRMFKTMNDCKAHHQKHFREKNPLSKDKTKGTMFPDDQKYPCRHCDKVFEKRSRQLVHENLQHKQKNDGTSFLCTLCSKVFAIKHYLMQHIKHCHSERRFSCPGCLQTFAQKNDVKKHFSTPGRCKGIPPDPKPFSCHQCGKGFSLKGNLGKHLQRPGRCRGANTRNPDVIVVLQQSENQENGEEENTVERENDTTSTIDGEQYEHDTEAAKEYTPVVAHALAGSEELGQPRIVQIEQGDQSIQSVSLQGIVNGELVPVMMTSEEGDVQYQVVTEVYQYSDVVDSEERPLVTYGSEEDLEGQHVHLAEETVMAVAPGEQVYTLLEKIQQEGEVMQSVDSHDVVKEAISDHVIDGELVVDGYDVLPGHGTTEEAQVDTEERYSDTGHVFAAGQGNRIIIQGQSVIPMEEGDASTPHSTIHHTDSHEGVVKSTDIVTEQGVLHVKEEITAKSVPTI